MKRTGSCCTKQNQTGPFTRTGWLNETYVSAHGVAAQRCGLVDGLGPKRVAGPSAEGSVSTHTMPGSWGMLAGGRRELLAPQQMARLLTQCPVAGGRSLVGLEGPGAEQGGDGQPTPGLGRCLGA